MADNYLENKMEEHRRGTIRPAVKSASKRAGVLAPGLHLQYPPMWIAILAYTAAEVEPFVTVLRSAGISVALCCREGGREAVTLAQKFGARLYPDRCPIESLLADLAKNGSNPYIIVNLRSDSNIPGAIFVPALSSDIPASVLARELLFLIHPTHENLLKAQTLFEIQG